MTIQNKTIMPSAMRQTKGNSYSDAHANNGKTMAIYIDDDVHPKRGEADDPTARGPDSLIGNTPRKLDDRATFDAPIALHINIRDDALARGHIELDAEHRGSERALHCHRALRFADAKQ